MSPVDLGSAPLHHVHIDVRVLLLRDLLLRRQLPHTLAATEVPLAAAPAKVASWPNSEWRKL